MKELFLKFWTMESYATRLIRILIVNVGIVLAGSNSPLPDEWLYIGLIVSNIGAAITGGAGGTKSGIPNKED